MLLPYVRLASGLALVKAISLYDEVAVVRQNCEHRQHVLRRT